MLRKLLRHFRSDDRADVLYGQIVAQARQPEFYAGIGVADTPEGRFDMIILHIVLIMRRLHREGDTGAVLAQDLFDLFFADMDRNLREMGTSDLAVPKRVRGMAEAFQGRAAAYGDAIDADSPDQLKAALERNLFGRKATPEDGAVPDGSTGKTGGGTGGPAAMATYMFDCERVLSNMKGDAVAAAEIDWPKAPDAGGHDSGAGK